MTREFTIKVPASSANIGPGFDVLGIGLNLYLTLSVSINESSPSKISQQDPYNVELTYSGSGNENVPLQSDLNLITKTALYVLHANNISSFPIGTKINVNNPIPLGRGLGSSGSAIVAGVLLANEVGGFGFDKNRCLDYCLMIERHPDNITATMMGGFVGSFLRNLSNNEFQIVNQDLNKILPSPNTPKNFIPSNAPLNLGTHVKYPWNPLIKCIAVIPQFEVKTEDSRNVLPSNYSRNDVIFNLQRLAVLTSAVGDLKPIPDVIYNSMQDSLHQPYRKVLIPGLTEILSSFTPKTHDGLLGICLSGAGPTILCLATKNFDQIANDIIEQFKSHDVKCTWKLLEIADEGAIVEQGSKL
ncbi:Trihydroxynaphthalene reductase [Pichia californica]|uniref:Homoserine kinase n=1 Tax=Pichia californica TaxID=460514 RepID=A0A9P6WMS1_9ASCO|nr:Trihydroxynaphthalene reductase [[Candida] californica]KAG0689952.1 Trihydroxynaphthalene reductase [[Candida] californica]